MRRAAVSGEPAATLSSAERALAGGHACSGGGDYVGGVWDRTSILRSAMRRGGAVAGTCSRSASLRRSRLHSTGFCGGQIARI